MALLLLGFLAARRLPLSLLPEVGIPRLTVQVTYPNAAARTVEDAVVQPLRNTLMQVNNLDDIQSRTRDESSVLFLEFPFGTDPDLAFIEVNEKIDLAMNQLPREVDRPRVLASDVSDIPVVQLSVTIDSARAGPTEMLELSALARNVLRRRLEQLEEVAFADLSGQVEPRIVVRPNREVLRALGLREEDLGQLVREANVDLGSLLLVDGHYQYNVRFTGDLRSADDLRELYLNVPAGGNSPGRILALSELAQITYEASPPRGEFFHNGRPGVVFQLRKRADARLFDLRDNLQTLLEAMRLDYPQLQFSLNNDQTSILRASIDNLTGGLLYGAGFAILILFAFFREWRRPLLIGLAVPVALLIAVLGFYLAGLSINVISLAGLILGLGLMIDNSIIVLDNIASMPTANSARGRREVIAEATDEVIRPLISSALTTVAVFLPLVLISGIAGALFLDQAVAVTLSLAASLLVAYFLLPTLSLLLSGSTKNKEDISTDSPAENISWALPSKWWLAVTIPWLILGYITLDHLGKRGFPELSRTDFRLAVDWNESLPLSEHRARVSALSKDWQARYGGEVSAFIGEDLFLLAEENRAYTSSEIQLFLAEAPTRGFADNWLDSLRLRYPRAGFTFSPMANLFDRIFASQEPYLEIRLRSASGRLTPPWEEVQPLVQALAAEGFAPATPSRTDAITLKIDYAQLQVSKVSTGVLRQKLLTLFSENEVTRLRSNDQSLPVLIAGAAQLLSTDLFAETVTNQDGNEIPLRYLINTKRQREYGVLTADAAGEYIALGFTEGVDAEFINDIVANYPVFNPQLAGRFLTERSQLQELGGILLISLLLLYLILAAQFEGLRLPFVVLLTVPISLVGSVLTLWIVGDTLNLLSLIGMVVTGGIVVNDAIIKVDMIERARRAGLALPEALREANRRRLRAIVMTSLTTILALAPVLFTAGLGAELQRPLAVTVIGGLLVGTLASLYFIPLLYRVFSARPPVPGVGAGA